MDVICVQGPGGVGRCPNCRSYVKKADGGGGFEVADQVDTCSLCNQVRVIVAEDGRLKMCDACTLGRQHPLLYECEGCGRFQRIPHPMWRYQERGPNAFGTVTWACHVRCQAQTHWRVAPNDAARVPAFDCPEGWGRRDEWLAAVREQRRRGGALAGAVAPAEERRQEATVLVLAFVFLLLAGYVHAFGYPWSAH
jgi:hypothetical protein